MNKKFIKNLIGEADVLGNEFWKEINSLIPIQGPKIDMYQTNEEMIVLVELPGDVSLETIKLKLERQTLAIRGEVPYTYPIDPEELLQSERFLGSFQRKIDLPSPVDRSKVSAVLRNGILTIKLALKPSLLEPSVDIQIEREG